MEWAGLPDDESSRTVNAPTAPRVRRNPRIILVEDLHPRATEQLGVQLKILPGFTLAHCGRFMKLSRVDEACA